MRQVNCTQIFGKRKITIKKNDKKIYIILAKIYSIKVKLPVVKYDKILDTNK